MFSTTAWTTANYDQADDKITSDEEHSDRLISSKANSDPTSQAGKLSHFWRRSGGAGQNFSSSTTKLVEASWRTSTERIYGYRWDRRVRYCTDRGILEASPSFGKALVFLFNLYDEGLSWSYISV